MGICGSDYFGARYYDPSIGRWLTPDPADQYHSPYVYCDNNPLRYVDKDGRLGVLPLAIPFILPLLVPPPPMPGTGALDVPKCPEFISRFVTTVVDRFNELGEMMEQGTQQLLQEANKKSEAKSKKAEDSSKGERHGDKGRKKSKSEQRIEKLKEQLKDATKKEQKKIKKKIENVRKDAERAQKGETHWRK
ncbi:RHS repeat-associated core domain-containing protein [bacterium]|nr:RHS repeat-associated core domain-containing protein [bacterium]